MSRRAVAVLLSLAIVVLAVLLLMKRRPEIGAADRKARAETPYKAGEIMALPAGKLVAVLQDADATEFAKAKACQRLAVVGGPDEVAALAPLLGDERLSHYARTALEVIPDPAAGAALRAALETVRGKQLIGVINSIGRRRDGEATDALSRLRNDVDNEIALAAWQALSKIQPALSAPPAPAEQP